MSGSAIIIYQDGKKKDEINAIHKELKPMMYEDKVLKHMKMPLSPDARFLSDICINVHAGDYEKTWGCIEKLPC